MDIKLLKETAKFMVSRTILAADESTKTIKKKLETIGIESTPEINRLYRQLLFTSPNIEQYVSGVILYDETLRQATDDEVPFPIYLEKKGIASGIKVDTGIVTVSEGSVDTYTQGLDGLAERLSEYKMLGARFAKWRAVFTIDDSHPSQEIITRNAQDLAAYALMCQNAGIVPIVEPEVLMDGNHSLEQDLAITTGVLQAVFQQLNNSGVDLEGIVLKPNMITSGNKCAEQASPTSVAETTMKVLKEIVPSSVPGIAFLSGGQSPDLATTHLNEINKLKNTNNNDYPWRITASYGRALQGETLEAWSGKRDNLIKAQETFINRAEKVYKASLGQL